MLPVSLSYGLPCSYTPSKPLAYLPWLAATQFSQGALLKMRIWKIPISPRLTSEIMIRESSARTQSSRVKTQRRVHPHERAQDAVNIGYVQPVAVNSSRWVIFRATKPMAHSEVHKRLINFAGELSLQPAAGRWCFTFQPLRRASFLWPTGTAVRPADCPSRHTAVRCCTQYRVGWFAT